MSGEESAAEIAQAASKAGTPTPVPRQLRGSEKSAALLQGYVDKFQKWGGQEQVFSLLALTAVLASFFFSSIVVPIFSAVLLLIIVLAQIGQKTWLGRYVGPRLLLLIFPATLASQNASSTVLVFCFAIALTGEALLRRPLVTLPMEPAANFAAMHALPSMKFDRTVFCMMVGSELGLLVVVAAELPRVLELMCVVVAYSVIGYSAWRIKSYRLAHHRMVVQKIAQLRALKPKYLLHWDGPDNGMYQVSMWAEYLKRVGLPFAIVVRKDRHVRSMARETQLPVIHIGDTSDVDSSIVPTLTTIVYVNTTVLNAHYIRFTSLKHVQINHGDSDKPASVSPMFRMFDVNFVAGQAAIDRFEHFGVAMPRELIRAVGRPQVESVRRRDASKPPRVVLYAPTWAGYFGDSDFSSLRNGPEIVKALIASDKEVIFRPHAFTDRNDEIAQKADEIRKILAEDSRRSDRKHLYGHQTESSLNIVECFNLSDAMVADISSIVSDYLFSEKPISLVAANTTVENFHRSFPISKRLPVIAENLENLDSILADMLESDSGLPARIDAKHYYLGDFATGDYANVFVSSLRAAIDGDSTFWKEQGR